MAKRSFMMDPRAALAEAGVDEGGSRAAALGFYRLVVVRLGRRRARLLALLLVLGTAGALGARRHILAAVHLAIVVGVAAAILVLAMVLMLAGGAMPGMSALAMALVLRVSRMVRMGRAVLRVTLMTLLCGLGRGGGGEGQGDGGNEKGLHVMIS
jgi:hypothetical protein